MIKKYLDFIIQPKDDRKTDRYLVVSSVDKNTILGGIYFYPQWRRYVFTGKDAIFDSACLTEIRDFLDELMKERRGKE